MKALSFWHKSRFFPKEGKWEVWLVLGRQLGKLLRAVKYRFQLWFFQFLLFLWNLLGKVS